MELLMLLALLLLSFAIIAEPYFRNMAFGATQATDLTHSEGQKNGAPRLQSGDDLNALLLELQDIEFDHAMGKISWEDFAELDTEYRRRAILAMKSMEGDQHDRNIQSRRDTKNDSRSGRTQTILPKCPVCQENGLQGDRYCTGCGTAL